MDDENIFMVAGFVDTPTEYKGAIGVYDYFWAITPDIRSKLIASWKKSIDQLEADHEALQTAFDAEDEYGSMALFQDEEAVEVRPPSDNVIQFPS
jgi:hypothetical protein